MITDTALTTQAATAAQGQSKSPSAGGTNLSADYESFLKLLTAQISNQDPMAPMESTEFISQLAQLSSVEQSVKTNDTLAGIAGVVNGAALMADVGLIGRNVTVPSEAVSLSDGSAKISYELENASNFVRISILGEDGTVVNTLEGSKSGAGERVTLDWDGRDVSGKPVPDGVYKVEINAETPEGDTIAYNTFATTAVRRVEFDAEGSVLELANGDKTRAWDVISVQ